MSPNDGEITHVSDTALMVAACRAHETAQPDAFLHDPFAARLAVERGVAILNALPHANVARMGLPIRARFVDELLMEALATHSIPTVVSLGAGLDTRPWRLDLPSSLRWMEVDVADVLEYKDRLMVAETPRCRRDRLSVDVNDPAQRRIMYEAVGQTPALVLTEGLLMYLPAATVDALAAEFRSQSGVAHWISDLTTTAFTTALGGADAMKSIRHVQASDSLKGEQILEVLQRHGWKTESMRSYIRDVGFMMERFRRTMGGATPPPPPVPAGDPTGVHRFARG